MSRSDETAAYGVAARVARVVGAKVAVKIGLTAIVIGIVKEIGILVLAACAGFLVY